MERNLPFVLALVVTPVGVDAGKWYLLVLRKYAVFSGRSQRMEFWMFTLVHSIVLIGLGLIEGLLFGSGSDDPILASIYNLGVVIPAIAVGVRRLHDTDHSGWWTIVPFVNFYFWCIDGTSGDNRFGPDPKGVARDLTKANLIPDLPIDRDSPPPTDVTVPIASLEPEAQPEPQLQKEPGSTPDPQIQQEVSKWRFPDRPPAAEVTIPAASPEPEAQPEPQLWRYCEDCGGKVSKRLTACSHCGCPVEPKVTCPDCGENFVASLAACPACGGLTVIPS